MEVSWHRRAIRQRPDALQVAEACQSREMGSGPHTGVYAGRPEVHGTRWLSVSGVA